MDEFEQKVLAYEAIHTDPRNRALHAVGIPIILYSMLLAAAYLREQPGFFVHGGSLLMAGSGSVLLWQSPKAALWYFALITPLWLLASATSLWLAPAHGLGCAGAAFALGWALQLWGHAFERKAPRLLTTPLNAWIGPVLVAQTLARRFGG